MTITGNVEGVCSGVSVISVLPPPSSSIRNEDIVPDRIPAGALGCELNLGWWWEGQHMCVCYRADVIC